MENLGKGSRIFLKVLVVLAVLVAVAAVGGFFYWQHLKTTPQYSLALLVKAAREDDRDSVARFVDSDAVVDNFVPIVIAKATDMYGRGIPPELIDALRGAAEPLMPALKQRVRLELPGIIKEKTSKLDSVPYFVMVVAADRYLDITVDGDTAKIKSFDEKHPFEAVMKRSGADWRISEIKDDELAEDIARKTGQQIMAFLTSAKGGNAIKIPGGVSDILRQAEQLIR